VKSLSQQKVGKESKIILQPKKPNSMEVKQEVIDDFAKGTRTELDTTLRDVTKFVDEIDRKTTKIPVVKPLKYKELKTKDFKEFITDPTDKDKVDVHNL